MEKRHHYEPIYLINRNIDEVIGYLKRLKRRARGTDMRLTAIDQMLVTLEEQRTAINVQFLELLSSRERNDERYLRTQRTAQNIAQNLAAHNQT